jgi:amino acid transporter
MQRHRSENEANIASASLRRSIGLTGLVLYGLGVTIGAGIYVLVGETVLRAGEFAPASFLLSAFVMAFTAGAFAELVGRVPKAAGEANYIEAAFRLAPLTVIIGLAILIEAMIAAAAITVGASGYVAQVIPLPQPALIVLIIVVMATVAAWGIRETVIIAGIMTVAEVAGLLVIIGAGIGSDSEILASLPRALVPPLSDWVAVSGVFSASLIAFFAYIGFDDVVNLVEEARNPRRIMPWALGLTLLIVTLLYVLVSHISATAIPVAEFKTTTAPISLLFERLTGFSPLTITLVAILATMNGVGIILVMAARVTYGMARERRLPAWIGKVNPHTRTPLRATVLVATIVLGLALFTPLDTLAETTSEVLLSVFVFVNAALVWLKIRRVPAPQGTFTVPLAVPVLGAIFCLFLLIAGKISGA